MTAHLLSHTKKTKTSHASESTPIAVTISPSTTRWNVASSDTSWLTATPTSGSASGTYKISATPNIVLSDENDGRIKLWHTV